VRVPCPRGPRGRRRLKPALGARRGSPLSPPPGTGPPPNRVAFVPASSPTRAGGFRGEPWRAPSADFSRRRLEPNRGGVMTITVHELLLRGRPVYLRWA